MAEGSGENDFRGLLMYEGFKNFALSMLGIFIPILIYEQTGNLLLSGLFLLAAGLTSIVIALPVMKVLEREGFYTGLGLSYIFLLPGIGLAYFIQADLLSVLALAILFSVGRSLHRESLNLEFAEDTDEDEREKKAAELMALPNLGRLLGPVVGGAAAGLYGFQAMVTVSLAAVLASVVPLYFVSSKHETDPKLESAFKKEFRPFFPVFISRGIQAVASVAVFSLFTFVVVGGFFNSGAVRSLDTVGFILVAYLSGYISSKYSRRKVILTGSALAALTYIGRVFVSTPFEAYLVSIVGGIGFKLYHIPLFSEFADEAGKNGETGFYTAKRIFTSLGKVLASGLFMAGLFFNPKTAFNSVFALAALSIPFMVYYENTVDFKD